MFIIQGFSGKYATLNGLIFDEVPFPEALIEVSDGEAVDVSCVRERVYLLSPSSVAKACERTKRDPTSCKVLQGLISRSEDFVFGVSHQFCVMLRT
jgi:hypothetical protein